MKQLLLTSGRENLYLYAGDVLVIERNGAVEGAIRMGAAELQSFRPWPTMFVLMRSLRSRRFRSSQTESVNQKASLCHRQLRRAFLDLNADFGWKMLDF